ncbi:E3 ubiquitin-protein ligase UHRF1-like [Halichondria panicea]|uniref:E3 ubiquitin-protein ligase UHRF1-like n=1 Tax=Halichondria panicea TaxID=6063 RepID=UPI00312B5ED2
MTRQIVSFVAAGHASGSGRLALTCTCDCPLNDKTGDTVLGSGQTANQWSGIRNYKGRKSPEYAPEEGNKYDGIYKVVKYWPEKNKNGFIGWKYLFRRDESHASWIREGKKAIKKLGLTMEYPDGYLEAQAAKKQSKEAEADGGVGSDEEAAS